MLIKTTRTNLLKSFFGVLIALSFLSCDSKMEYDSYQSIAKGKWLKNDKVNFTFSISDTTNSKNLYINIRNNNAYPFSNLFLITELQFPNQEKVIDTLEYEMADNTGKFLGSGFSEVKDNKLFYKENIVFPNAGQYSFSVTQAMRKNGDPSPLEYLEGVTEVGFRIEKTN